MITTVNQLKEQGLTLTEALKTVGLAKSSYYYRPKERKPRPLDQNLVKQLQELPNYEQTYGYRKVREYLIRQGSRYNKKKVLRHMQRLHLTQPRKIKGVRWTQLPYQKPERPNQRWEADIVYVAYGWGQQACLCAVKDCYDQEILGDCFSRFFMPTQQSKP